MNFWGPRGQKPPVGDHRFIGLILKIKKSFTRMVNLLLSTWKFTVRSEIRRIVIHGTVYVPVVAPYRKFVPLSVVEFNVSRTHLGADASGAVIHVHVKPTVDHFDGVNASLEINSIEN